MGRLVFHGNGLKASKWDQLASFRAADPGTQSSACPGSPYPSPFGGRTTSPFCAQLDRRLRRTDGRSPAWTPPRPALGGEDPGPLAGKDREQRPPGGMRGARSGGAGRRRNRRDPRPPASPSMFSRSLMCCRLQPVSSRLKSASGRQDSSREWAFLRSLGLDDTQHEAVFPMAGAPAPARPRVSSGGGGAASPWAARLPSPGPAACPRRRSARARATAAARPGSPRRRHGRRRAAASASRSARLRAGGRKRFRFRGRGRSGRGDAGTRGRGANAGGGNADSRGRRERWQRGGAAPGLGVGGRGDSGPGPPGPALRAVSRPAPRALSAPPPGTAPPSALEADALPRRGRYRGGGPPAGAGSAAASRGTGAGKRGSCGAWASG